MGQKFSLKQIFESGCKELVWKASKMKMRFPEPLNWAFK